MADLYKERQDAYWSSSLRGRPREQALKFELGAQLRVQVALRYAAGTLSRAGRDTVNAVLANPDGLPDALSGKAPGINALWVKGKPEPGAFVLTQRDSLADPGATLLWRPGWPLQEFADMAELKSWLANEKNIATTDIEKERLHRNVFEQRVEGLREAMQARFMNVLRQGPVPGQTLGERLDGATDAGPYLDVSPAVLGLRAEYHRQLLKGKPEAQQELKTLQAETLKAEDSSARLVPLLGKIKSLAAFADEKIRESLVQDYPGYTFDPANIRITEESSVLVNNVDDRSPPQLSRRKRVLMQVAAPRYEIQQREYSLRDKALANVEPWDVSLFNLADNKSVSMRAPLTDASGQPVRDRAGQPVVLDKAKIDTLVQKLNVGQQYADMLKKRLDPAATSGEPKAIRELWKTANIDRMKLEAHESRINPEAVATFKWQSRDKPWEKRGLLYVDAVLNHPDPATRPTVDTHRIVANHLVLGAANSNTGGGQVINGVLVISTGEQRASPAVVLYTPDAPDGVSFRELESAGKIEGLTTDPKWKDYFASRMATRDQERIDKILGGRVADRGRTVLRPTPGNVQDSMYKEQAGFMISHAAHRSTTNAQVKSQSTFNKVMFAIDVVDTVSDLIPFKAGLGALRRGLRAGLNGLPLVRKIARLPDGRVGIPLSPIDPPRLAGNPVPGTTALPRPGGSPRPGIGTAPSSGGNRPDSSPPQPPAVHSANAADVATWSEADNAAYRDELRRLQQNDAAIEKIKKAALEGTLTRAQTPYHNKGVDAITNARINSATLPQPMPASPHSGAHSVPSTSSSAPPRKKSKPSATEDPHRLPPELGMDQALARFRLLPRESWPPSLYHYTNGDRFSIIRARGEGLQYSHRDRGVPIRTGGVFMTAKPPKHASLTEIYTTIYSANMNRWRPTARLDDVRNFLEFDTRKMPSEYKIYRSNEPGSDEYFVRGAPHEVAGLQYEGNYMGRPIEPYLKRKGDTVIDGGAIDE